MIKKAFLMLALLLATTVQIGAQEVYNEIKRKVQASLDDDTTNSAVRKISQFKMDALDYMLLKMREQMPDSATYFLDRQAYDLNQFVSVYIGCVTTVAAQSKEQQVEVMKLFVDASVSNPLFNDPDTELTLSYYNNDKCLTPFSLDTDWRKALAAVLSYKFGEKKD